MRAEAPAPAALAERSVAVILAGQAPSGAYLASPTFAPYHYSWLRDGAFIADAMSRAGEIESAEAFFGWCSRLVLERRREIAGGEHLHARYTVDGREVDDSWPKFQLDGYGTWLWALAAHAARHDRSAEPFRAAAELTADYLSRLWQEPCVDWWEERRGLHTATLAALYAGLAAWGRPEAGAIRAAVLGRAARGGRLVRDLDGVGLDASLLACATPFRLLEPGDPLAAATLAAVEAELVSPQGGVHRHREDVYYGGGEWLLLAGFLGWHYAELGRLYEARRELEWIAAQARAGGELPEQVSDRLLAPAELEVWETRWGPSASPLLWSHAMYLTLACVLGTR